MESLLAPLAVGLILTYFEWWLNNRKQKVAKKRIKNPSGVPALGGFRFPWKAALFRTFIVSLSVENVNCELYSPPAH